MLRASQRLVYIGGKALMDQPFRTTFAAFTAVFLTLAPWSARAQAGSFDFYVLSLSWSPTFCATQPEGRNSLQCGDGSGYNFIVHGLWPQYERGYPEYCASREPQRVPRAVGEKVLDIMPSMGLVGHQWRKHGSCSGLSQRDYFTTLRAAYERVTLPDTLEDATRALSLSPREIEAEFLRVNPGMSAAGIAASCDGRRLEEVRICLTRDLQFRDCREVDHRGCRLNQVQLPAAK